MNNIALALVLLLGTVCADLETRDERLSLTSTNGDSLFNPSIVTYNGQRLASARSLNKQPIDGVEWWLSDAQVCYDTTPAGGALFSHSTCASFDPWRDSSIPYRDCLKPPPGPGDKIPKKPKDARGIEDPKLFVWPGRGVYVTFNRKPHVPNNVSSPYCSMYGVVQYMMTVLYDTPVSAASPAVHPWNITKPIQLTAGDFTVPPYSSAGAGPIKEKNWMPFVYLDDLYFTYSITPHRVFRVDPSGTAKQQWVSSVKRLLPGEFRSSGAAMHGGPPLVFVPREASSTDRAYYLGIMHYFDMPRMKGSRAYHHYAYQMEPHPPFRICAVSRELPLRSYDPTYHRHVKATKWTRDINFISGLQLDLANGDVHMSYGAFDVESRLMSVKLHGLEGHFDAVSDCSKSMVLEAEDSAVLPRRLSHPVTSQIKFSN